MNFSEHGITILYHLDLANHEIFHAKVGKCGIIKHEEYDGPNEEMR